MMKLPTLAILILTVLSSIPFAGAGAVGKLEIEGVVESFNARNVRIVTGDGHRTISRSALPSKLELEPGKWVSLSWTLEEAARLRIPAAEKARPFSR